jgi:hypothetical protein
VDAPPGIELSFVFWQGRDSIETHKNNIRITIKAQHNKAMSAYINEYMWTGGVGLIAYGGDIY